MYVELEKKENYAILTLNREKALNALNSEVLSEIREAIRELISDTKMRGVIVTGKGEKAFCAGADITEMKGLNFDQAEEFARKGHKTMNMIAGSDLISIAAINGYAFRWGIRVSISM
ncbi:MAG: hypothetical protein KatS3mg129_3139 [Leptospiraceae bacterium]|nr:MAG: hypothetical protein KatS3mg129_3139 [Leptospiraceae bacterium]